MSALYPYIRIIAIITLGSLQHFFYDWSGKNKFVGYFSSVNESTWEHLKLIFFPMLLLTVIEGLFRENNFQTFLSARTIAILSGMLFIVVAFYTIWGITGKLIAFVNISIFALAVIFAFWVDSRKIDMLSAGTSVLILAVMVFLFIFFTYKSPNKGIFYDFSNS